MTDGMQFAWGFLAGMVAACVFVVVLAATSELPSCNGDIVCEDYVRRCMERSVLEHGLTYETAEGRCLQWAAGSGK